MAVGQYFTFDDDFGPGRDFHVDVPAGGNPEPFAQQTADAGKFTLVIRHQGHGPQGYGRMDADDHRGRQIVAGPLGAAEVFPQPLSGMKTYPEFVRAFELHPMVAAGVGTGIGVFGRDQAGGHIGTGVYREMGQDRKPVQIHPFSGQAMGLKGGLGDDLRGYRRFDTPGKDGRRGFRRDIEGQGQALTGCQDIGHHRKGRPLNVFKKNHGIAFESIQFHNNGSGLIYRA